jgi:hypothetical protein
LTTTFSIRTTGRTSSNTLAQVDHEKVILADFRDFF